jgi:Domain of unknown function (DUF1905)
MDDMAGLDPELIRFLREELGVEQPVSGGWDYTGPVWLWRPKTSDGSPKASTMAWHFLTIDGAVADGIRAAAPGRSAAWGSVYVKVRIGTSSWETSVFPSKEVNGFLLPIKAAIRKKENIVEGDVVTVELSL